MTYCKMFCNSWVDTLVWAVEKDFKNVCIKGEVLGYKQKLKSWLIAVLIKVLLGVS